MYSVSSPTGCYCYKCCLLRTSEGSLWHIGTLRSDSWPPFARGYWRRSGPLQMMLCGRWQSVMSCYMNRIPTDAVERLRGEGPRMVREQLEPVTRQAGPQLVYAGSAGWSSSRSFSVWGGMRRWHPSYNKSRGRPETAPGMRRASLVPACEMVAAATPSEAAVLKRRSRASSRHCAGSTRLRGPSLAGG